MRSQLDIFGVHRAASLADIKDKTRLTVAGLVLVRQRPGTAGGVCFMTLEDETGVVNIIVFESLFEKYRKAILGARLLCVYGQLQKEDGVIHVIAKALEDRTDLLKVLNGDGAEPSLFTPAPQVKRLGLNIEAPYRDGRPVIPAGRNFR